MYDQNVTPSLVAGHLARHYLKDDGMLVLTGADSVYKEPLPATLSYALSKNLVHSLALNLAAED